MKKLFHSLAATLARIPRKQLLRNTSFTLAVAVILQAAAVSPLAVTVDKRMFYPLVFGLREKLREPKLDPRIKILAYDDRTAAGLKALDIPLPLWGQVLQKVGTIDNVKIVVDKLFDVPYSSQDLASFEQTMTEHKADVGIISFVQPDVISYRQTIAGAKLESNFKTRVKISDERFLKSLPLSNGFPYGAAAAILDILPRFGHAHYEGDSLAKPILRLADDRYLLHAALAMADNIAIEKSGLVVNGVRVPIDRDGSVLINFAPKSFYLKNAYSFLPVVERTKNGKDLPIISPGDYVVILPAMYTGNTDFRETPFGPMAGGFHVVALLQSMLSGDWLTHWHDPNILVILCAVFGYVVGFAAKPRIVFASMFAASTSLTLISAVLFVYFGVAFSLMFATYGFIFGCMRGMVLHSQAAQIEELRIQRELEVAILVQNTFFPDDVDQMARTGRLRIDGRFRPASECGGDWWGSFHRNGYTYVLIGDAVGHGVPAALVTAVAFSVTKKIEAELESSPDQAVSPSFIMYHVSQVLLAMKSQLACMTFFALRIHEASHECMFANGGNQQPFLVPITETDDRLPAGQRSIALKARGDILGVSFGGTSQDHTIQLKPGDRIAVFTDGLIENTRQSTGKALGRAWLKHLIQDLVTQGSRTMCEDIWTTYLTAIGRVAPADDATLVVVEIP